MAWAKRFVDDIITSPLNICLVALICYFSYKLIRKDTINTTSNKKRSTSVVKKRLEDMPKQDFTLEQLREYDGVKSSGRLLIGVLGRVFDVSSASEFYGPGLLIFANFFAIFLYYNTYLGGPYSVFAGRDASRALATFSVDPTQFKDTYDDLSDLNTSQLGSVKEWEMQFLGTLTVLYFL